MTPNRPGESTGSRGSWRAYELAWTEGRWQWSGRLIC